MSKVKVGLAAICLLSLTLSACHGVQAYEMRKMRWVSQADGQEVMQFEIKDLTVMGRVHAAIFTTKVRGTYVHKKGDTVISQGTLSQEPPGFILKSADGEEHRFALDKPGSIKGDDGELWRLDNPKPVAVLREW